MGTLVGSDTGAANVQNITTISWPTVAAGDLAILFWTHADASTESTLPSGFTQIDAQVDGAVETTCWTKVCTGSESGTLTIGLGAIARQSAVLVVVRGYTGVNQINSVGDTGTDANHTAPAVTPTVSGGAVIIANGERVTSGSTSMTPPANYTVAAQAGSGGTAGSFTGVAYKGSAGTLTDDGVNGVAINPGTMVNNVAASDVTVWTLYLEPEASAVEGTAAATFTVTATAAGVPTTHGTAAATFAVTATAAGVDRSIGQASASFAVASTAAGTRRVVATATRTFGFTGTAAGASSSVTQGTASASFGGAGAAAGIARTLGTAVGLFGGTGAAAGVPRTLGTALGSFGGAGAAAGVARTLGAAVGMFGVTGAAAGVRRGRGTAVAALALTGVAAGAPRAPANGTISGPSKVAAGAIVEPAAATPGTLG